MSYAFDTSPLSALFRNYYRNVFRTLWQGFDELVASGKVLSVREVKFGLPMNVMVVDLGNRAARVLLGVNGERTTTVL
jgi:hypothetical protein